MNNKVSLKTFVSVILFFAGIILAIYIAMRQNPSLDSREITPSINLIFNGYLGAFFRFRIFPLVTFFVLPLGVLYFKERKINYEIIVILSCLLLSMILIGYRGYYNYRYQLTLVPVILILASKFLKAFDRKKKAIFYLGAFCLTLVSLKKSWKPKRILPQDYHQEKIAKNLEPTIQDFSDQRLFLPSLSYIEENKIDDILVFDIAQIFLKSPKRLYSHFSIQKMIVNKKVSGYRQYIENNKIKYLYLSKGFLTSMSAIEKLVNSQEFITLIEKSTLIVKDRHSYLFRL